jgi:hypothetical protein
MKSASKSREGGLIKAILLIVIALIVLGFFGYNLRDIIASPAVQDNLAYAWGLVVKLWDMVLATPARWIWDNIIINLIWNNLQGILSKTSG